MKRISITLLSALMFFNTNVFSQSFKVKNIHFRTIEEKIEIFYDLPINSDSIDVKLFFLKKSSPKFKYHPQFISGDVGIGIFSGANNKIVWDFKKEPDYLFTGNGFYFKINAVKVPKREDLNQK